MTQQSPPVLVVPIIAFVLAVVAAAGAGVFMAVGTAHAEISGPCEATIASVQVGPLNSGSRSDDIHVSRHQAVPVSATSAAGFRSHKVQLEFASRRWTVSSKQDDGSTTWSDTVNVDDYARYGVGLYKVIGVSVLSDGTTCTGAATVDVDGNPLTTVAGGVAAGATVLGVVGVLATGANSAANDAHARPMAPVEEMVNMMQEQSAIDDERRNRDRLREAMTRPSTSNFDFLFWLFYCACMAAVAVVLTPIMAVTGGGGAQPQPRGQGPSQPGAPAGTAADEPLGRLPRPVWFPKITLVGLVGGFLAGAGCVVLLQQYSIEYPTLRVVLMDVIAAMVVGGLVVPTLGRTIAWLRLRGKVSRLERKLGIS